MEIIAVAKDGVHLFQYEPGEKLSQSPTRSFPRVPTAESIAWSADGALLALADPSSGGVNVYDAAAGYAQLCATKALVGGPARSFYFSPNGTYLVSWERHVKDAGSNCGVWDTKTGELAWSFIVKSQTGSSWPCLKWSSDESICCRMVQDEILIMDGKKLNSEEPRRLAAPKVASFEVSPGAEPAISILIPEVKGAPAKCLLYNVSSLKSPVASKSFYKAQEVRMMWNNSGSAILILTSTEVDDSGQNYYGNNHLYFMRLDGQEDKIISSADDGVVHAVSWSPTQNEFCLLNGKLPCSMAMYDGQKALERLNFGKGHRNTINWNPWGRFVALGGFGNLLGDVDFWDKPGKKVLGSVRMECCVVSDWSPDGRHFLAATTSPRMRVDNCIKIFDYVGGLLDTRGFEELLWAGWRPRPRGAFQDRPPSPGRQGAQAKAAEPKPKAQAYKPPGARGAGGGYAGGGGGLSALLRQELGSTSAGPQATTASKVTGKASAPMSAVPGMVPGMAPPDASAASGSSRNARKKKAKDAKDAADESASKAALEAALAPQPAPELPAHLKEKASAEATEGDVDVEKKVRNLRKKLRDIEKIKEKDGPLDPLQKQKIAGEADLIKQIKDLGHEP